MPIEKFELNRLAFLNVEPWDTFLRNTTVATLFIFFGGKMQFLEVIIKNKERFV